MDNPRTSIIATIAVLALAACGPITAPPTSQGHSSTPQTPQTPSEAPSEFYGPTATASQTPTPWWVEVTAAPTLTETPTPYIIEVGTPVVTIGPGDIWFEDGIYIPDGNQNIRECPAIDCRVLEFGARAGVPIKTVAWVLDSDRQVWVCKHVTVDNHGAELCDQALLYRAYGGRLGTYTKVVITPTPIIGPAPTPKE